MVSTLQQLLVSIVPTREIIHNNLMHLLGFNNRFLKDLISSKVEPIQQWFLSFLMDPENTSFFWFYQFIHKKINDLKINQAVFVGYQETYKEDCSMNMFAMRISAEKVIIFIYSNPHVTKEGFRYKYRRVLPTKIQEQKPSFQWTRDDWEYLSCLKLDCMFVILSTLKKNKE